MALDPQRAALVLQEYRYTTTYNDAAIKTRFPQAREIIIETNLAETGGKALAADIFAATKAYAAAFSVTVEGVYYPEDFTGSAPRYTLNFSRHPAADPSRTYTLASARIDYLANRTTFTVRG